MNMILEQINSTGHRFVEFALPMMVQSALLIAVLLLADLLLRKKVRAVVRYWLWMLVLLKLILPTNLSSPLSLGSWFGDELASAKMSNTNNITQLKRSPQKTYTQTTKVKNPSSAATPTLTPPPVTESTIVNLPVVSPPALTWQGIVLLVWATVVAAMGLLLLQRAIFVAGLVAQAKNPTEMMKNTFKFCCGQMGLKNKVGLKVSANTASPAVCGLFRPTILVPENLAPTFGAGHLRIVLLHEFAHIKRGDLWINTAQTILQIIYFYNPLLWLANFVIRRIREQAIDETVQVAMGAKAGQYPQTLIDVAKIAFNRPALSLRLIGVVESKSALKNRIKRMLDRPTPKSAKLGILGFVMLVVIGCTLLPMAKADKSKRVSQNPIGKWQSVDFVQKIEDFKPEEKSWQGELFIKGLEFYKDGKTSRSWIWKKGYLQDQVDQTKARYLIKEFDGARYLFMEWMSNDVTVRGQKPWYYVMKEVRNDKKNKSAELSKAVIVKEGVGFDDIIIGDINCTGEFIKSKFGKPSKEIKYETGRHLDYGKTYGLGFWVNKKDNVLKEIRLNKEFTGKLTSGISMSSSKEDVFDAYGQPIREEVVENFGQRFDNNVLLFKKSFSGIKSNIAKIYYDEYGLLFWFTRDNINQIVIFKKESNQQGKEETFKTTLDNGVTVELFGVCEYPSEGKQWWQPDGSALEKPPSYVSRQDKPIVNSNEEFNRLIEIAVGLSGAHLQDVSLHFEVPGATRTSVGDVTGPETEKLKSIACEVSKLFSSVQANVGVAAGSWETIGVQKADIEEIVEEKVNGGFITWDVPFEKQSKIRKRTGRRVVDTTIKVAHSFGDYDFRVTAKDRYGNIHKAPLSSGGGADALSTNEYRFPIHLAQIEEFQFQIRPYQWVTFKNVSLKPGHKTDVQVEAEDTKLLPTSFMDANGRIVDKIIVPRMEINVLKKELGESLKYEPIEKPNFKTDAQVDVKENSKISYAAKSVELKEQNQLNEAVYKQLNQVVDFSGLTPDMSFKRALDELKYSVDPPLKMVVLWQDLFDNADIDQATPINMDSMPSARLGTALKVLLKSVSNSYAEKLDYTVEDGIIYIATIESLPAKFETRVYDISGLTDSEIDDSVRIARLIINTVEPDRWEPEGGKGKIDIYNKKLVVYQTPEIHKKIQDLLQNLQNSPTGKK